MASLDLRNESKYSEGYDLLSNESGIIPRLRYGSLVDAQLKTEKDAPAARRYVQRILGVESSSDILDALGIANHK